MTDDKHCPRNDVRGAVRYNVTMRPPQPGPDDAGVAAVDAAIEELRHASYGYFGPASRASFHLTIRWPWSPAHYRLLRMVEASRLVPPTVNDLAGALATDAARASRIVTQLQRSGLVDRRIAVGDRRRREVVLTDAGQLLLDDARRARTEHLSTSYGTGTPPTSPTWPGCWTDSTSPYATPSPI